MEWLAAVVPVLPELGVGSLLFVFAIWRERAHNSEKERWVTERAGLIAEKREAVDRERKRRDEDDQRRDQRIGALAAENEELERRLDEERAARRQAEDSLRLPRLLEEGGAAS